MPNLPVKLQAGLIRSTQSERIYSIAPEANTRARWAVGFWLKAAAVDAAAAIQGRGPRCDGTLARLSLRGIYVDKIRQNTPCPSLGPG